MSGSSGNRLLVRAWMLSDHRHDPSKLGNYVVRTKETKPHALSHANTETTEEQEEQARRERDARLKFDKLEPLDRELLRLHLIRTESREVVMPFPASQRDGLERAGWLYTKTSKSGAVMMVKSVPGQLSHAEIGKRVHLSVSQVRRRLSRLDPALVKYAELRGWL